MPIEQTSPASRTDDAADLMLLRELVTDSGLSLAEFGRVVVARDPRTVRRWLSGEMPIPGAVTQWLARIKVEVTPHTARIVVQR